MTFDLWISLAIFALVSSITPGPNNMMLTASGLNFGLRRSLPAMLGVCLGFPVMVLLVGLGLAGVFATSVLLHQALRVVGTAYLVLLAYKIAMARPELSAIGGRSRPMRFLEAAAFQWVNPKAWVLAVGAAATYTTVNGDNVSEVLIIAGMFLIVAFPCCFLWTGFGTVMRRWLSQAHHIRIFNIVMALLLLGSIIPLLLE